MYYCIHIFFCVIRKCSYKHPIYIYIYKHLIIYSTFAEPNKPPSWRVVKPPTAEDRKVLKRGVVVLPPGSVKQRRQQEPHKHHANLCRRRIRMQSPRRGGWLAMASASSRGSRIMPNDDITVIANGVWPKKVAPCYI